MIYEIALLTLVTFIPGIELRGSIPLGIWNHPISLPLGFTVNGLGLDPLFVFTVAVIANIILGELVFFGLNYLLPFFLKVKALKRFYEFNIMRLRKKVRPHIEKYGPFELAAFIGIPLPGTGVYSGALLAFILGFKRRDFSMANILGVFLAGLIVTLVTVGALGALSFLL